MTLDELKTYNKICIVGYGLEGQSTEAFIKKVHPKAAITITDAHDGPKYLDKQYDADLVIKTPGLPKEYIKVPYTTATNLFLGNISNKVIAITGTKGKSTTTALLHHTLKTAGIKARLCGNIGIPMISLLTDGTLHPDELLCIELSSYQLDDIQYSPHIGVIVNISPEHMDYHGTFENYLYAKQRICEFMTTDDYYIYNPRFPELAHLSKNTKATCLAFHPRFIVNAESFYDTERFHEDDLAAIDTILDLYDIPFNTLKKAIKSFVSLPHRLEQIGTYHGIRFINDSASSNPVSAQFALSRIQGVATLIAGGMDRGYDATEFVRAIKKSSVKTVILLPDFGEKIRLGLKGKNITTVSVQSMEDAVKKAYETTPPGHTCLLSPGAPSYNMFTGFPDRGNQFKHLVQKLGS